MSSAEPVEVEEEVRPGLRAAVAAFRYRNFALFWTGALVSNTGGWVQNVTVPYVVFQLTDSAALQKTERLRPIADRLGCSMAQLALAWCTKHPMVSTVITGASKPSQVAENFAALDVIPLITDDVKQEIEQAVS